MGLLGATTQHEYYTGDNYGNYQFVSLNDIINQFMIVYVGEDKIISKAKRTDVAFHAQRAMQELSFDTFKSCKSQEIEIPPSLTMKLPQDYVNYVKLTWVDGRGVEHLIHPTSKTSNPTNPFQNSDGNFTLTAVGTLDNNSSTIVLDAEYKDIEVGMTITGSYIPSGTKVSATSNASGITTIEIWDGSAAVLPTESNTDTTLTFITADGSLISERSSYIVENLDWNINDFKITANSAADIADIEVGMLVSHEYFPVGTTVTNVSGTTIVVSNVPTVAVLANAGEVTFISPDSESDAWSNYKTATPAENRNDDYDDDLYWPNMGQRYGLDPQNSQVNGSFYMDCNTGLIHFSSNISGKTVILKYISDGLGTDEEMQVHKFAEEAMYKWIAYGILSSRINTPEYIINRYKKERFAETRKAKLRLSNIKLEEITQILRGKSKQIKH